MLTLPIKAKWYDMIRDGVKKEEYRDFTAYYNSRFQYHQGRPMQIILRNGYRKDSRTMECIVVPSLRSGARPEWGGDPAVTCWVLEIREILWDENGVRRRGAKMDKEE